MQKTFEKILKELEFPVRRDQEKLLALVQELDIRLKKLQLSEEMRLQHKDEMYLRRNNEIRLQCKGEIHTERLASKLHEKNHVQPHRRKEVKADSVVRPVVVAKTAQVKRAVKKVPTKRVN